MTTYTTDDRISAQQDKLAEHIIKAKKLLGEIELMTACPANTDLAKFEEKMIALDQQTSQLWVLLDKLKFEALQRNE